MGIEGSCRNREPSSCRPWRQPIPTGLPGPSSTGMLYKEQLQVRYSMIAETSSVSQLSQVISQAAAPGFILASLAAFTSLLIARQNRIVDRTIVLNGISDDDPVKSRLKADLPRLLRRAAMMNRAILWALISVAIAVLVVVAFTNALLHVQHEVGVAILFIVALVAFTISLVEFARKVRISLNELDHYG